MTIKQEQPPSSRIIRAAVPRRDPPRAPADIRWSPQPAAAELVASLLEDALARLPEASDLASAMLERTATRFGDWVDALVLPGSPGLSERLRKAGFVLSPRRGADTCFQHAGGDFPALILLPQPLTQLLIQVESVADFCAAHAIEGPIEGVAGGPFRRVVAWRGDKTELVAIERHGYDGFQVTELDPRVVVEASAVAERFRCRRRHYAREHEGFDHLEHLINAANIAIGRDMACDLFFAAEREYWMRRNRAGRLQKARQDILGLGWGNHDHHTYRSSRVMFMRLIQILESLGLVCRERFHPGPGAGWGAQVLEQPITGHVVFADVDMDPEEVRGDFAHATLPESRTLGTVGMWCALHGESLLEAGMHHLEGQFDFAALTTQLAAEGIGMMPAFTDLPYLRQAFTTAETWKVSRERAMRLLAADQIDARHARTFMEEGTLGSHLENLERQQGFKGFNQTGVDKIIAATDPRAHGA